MSKLTDMDEKLKPLLVGLMSTVRAANSLAAQDVPFIKQIEPELGQQIDGSSAKILGFVDQLLANTKGSHGSEFDREKVFTEGDTALERSWPVISETLDALFEASDIALDTYKKKKSKEDDASSYTYLEQGGDEKMTGNQKIDKPQLQFEMRLDNFDLHPFKPLLTSKPHMLVPLQESVKLIDVDNNNHPYYPNPYSTEIKNQPYPESMFQICTPQDPKPWESTSAEWVDTPEALEKMLAHLKTASEIAVDLEHHDYRSYYGIVCLMQISTRDQDYVIDTLSLRERLQVLNEVFTDPEIVKVFHGAFMDIVWLQRDLGLYVVSLFDTFHACKLLGLPRASLAFLLEKYVRFRTSKKYQLADWRRRPLSQAMMSYARSDTHFLLYIYDCMKNELIQRDKLQEVLYESRNVALKRFEYNKFKKLQSEFQNSRRSQFEPTGEPWQALAYQYNIPEAKKGLMKLLCDWRDLHARKEDESVRFVMPNQLLVSLVSAMPIDVTGVLSVSNNISPLVRKFSKEIAELIKHYGETEFVAKQSSGSVSQPKEDSPTQAKEVSLADFLTASEKLFSASPGVPQASQPRVGAVIDISWPSVNARMTYADANGSVRNVLAKLSSISLLDAQSVEPHSNDTANEVAEMINEPPSEPKKQKSSEPVIIRKKNKNKTVGELIADSIDMGETVEKPASQEEAVVYADKMLLDERALPRKGRPNRRAIEKEYDNIKGAKKRRTKNASRNIVVRPKKG